MWTLSGGLWIVVTIIGQITVKSATSTMTGSECLSSGIKVFLYQTANTLAFCSASDECDANLLELTCRPPNWGYGISAAAT